MQFDTIQSASLTQGTPVRETSPAQNRKADAGSATAPILASKAENTDNPATRPAVEKAVQLLSDFVSTIRPEINFSIDEASGMHVVKIIDSQSNEVIRQIPSEEAVRLAQALDKLQGLFVKDKA